jgi:hypothetical protein
MSEEKEDWGAMKEGKDTTKGEQKAMWKKMQNTYAENEVQEEKKCKTGENYVKSTTNEEKDI